MSAIQRWDKLQKFYEKFKDSGLEAGTDNFKAANMHLQKMILKKKFRQSEYIKQINLSVIKDGKYFQKDLLWISWRPPKKLPKAPNKFISQTTKNYYRKTSCNVSNDFKLSNVFKEVIQKILLSLDISKADGMDQISAKFLKDSAEV